MKELYEYRVEKVVIKQKHVLFKGIDELAFKAKNIYNSALYIQRNHYIEKNQFISYNNLEPIYKKQCKEEYYSLPPKTTQQILKVVYQTCKSFYNANIDFNKSPYKYRGKPKIPNYLPKNGRFNIYFTNQQAKYRDGSIRFPESVGIEPIRIRIELESIPDELGFKNNPINQVRIKPNSNSYTLEIVYTKTIPKPDTGKLKYYAGIDLGIDNFATIAIYGPHIRPLIINGKGLKSYNKNFNKKLAYYKSIATTRNKTKQNTKRINNLYEKRNRYMLDFYHKASRATINYLIKNEVSVLIIGYNEGWKQCIQLGKQVNQTFVHIGYKTYINQLMYKTKEARIKVILQEESYTSGTSFIDDEQPTKENYNKTRRKHRGLFISNQCIRINADINSAFQIINKRVTQAKYTRVQGLLSIVPIKLTINKQCIEV